MDPTWIKIFLSVGGVLVVLVSSLIAQFFRMATEIGSLRTHLAERYVSKEEFRSHTDRLETTVETGFTRLYSRLGSDKK